jgi:hypothetical protein
MPDNWNNACTDLRNFAESHPEIKLDIARMSIPENVRTEFWRLYEAAGEAYLKDRYPAVNSRIAELNCAYLNLKKMVAGQMGLPEDPVSTPVEAFLRKPSDALVKGKQSKAFVGFINGSADITAYEESAAEALATVFPASCQPAYENWAVMGLLQLLHASRLLEVKFKELSPTYILDFSPVKVPEPADVKFFSLKDRDPSLVMPVDFIAAVSAGFIGFKTNAVSFKNPKRPALNSIAGREWMPSGVIGRVTPGMTLVYIDRNPNGIALVADSQRICRPDIILECRWQSGWFNRKSLSAIKAHHDALKPVFGTFIISNEAVAEEAFSDFMKEDVTAEASGEKQEADLKQTPNITFLNVGLETGRLQPVADVIMSSKI